MSAIELLGNMCGAENEQDATAVFDMMDTLCDSDAAGDALRMCSGAVAILLEAEAKMGRGVTNDELIAANASVVAALSMLGMSNEESVYTVEARNIGAKVAELGVMLKSLIRKLIDNVSAAIEAFVTRYMSMSAIVSKLLSRKSKNISTLTGVTGKYRPESVLHKPDVKDWSIIGDVASDLNTLRLMNDSNVKRILDPGAVKAINDSVAVSRQVGGAVANSIMGELASVLTVKMPPKEAAAYLGKDSGMVLSSEQLPGDHRIVVRNTGGTLSTQLVFNKSFHAKVSSPSYGMLEFSDLDPSVLSRALDRVVLMQDDLIDVIKGSRKALVKQSGEVEKAALAGLFSDDLVISTLSSITSVVHGYNREAFKYSVKHARAMDKLANAYIAAAKR